MVNWVEKRPLLFSLLTLEVQAQRKNTKGKRLNPRIVAEVEAFQFLGSWNILK